MLFLAHSVAIAIGQLPPPPPLKLQNCSNSSFSIQTSNVSFFSYPTFACSIILLIFVLNSYHHYIFPLLFYHNYSRTILCIFSLNVIKQILPFIFQDTCKTRSSLAYVFDFKQKIKK